MDLIFIAAIAGYLIYRLYSVLGEKEGFTKPKEENNVYNLRSTAGRSEQDRFHEIRKYDPGFDEKYFAQGAQSAFWMIVAAYRHYDYNTLKNLLSSKLYKDFEQGMKAQKSENEISETTIERVRSVDIEDINVKGSVAKISTKIVSEQINVVRDKAGTLIDGDENQIDIVTDIWTFERDLRSSDPTWKLVETATIEYE